MSEENVVSIKMLLGDGLAGSIIGKGGALISELSEISGARIKISGSTDCYPGTSDQVVYVSGSFEAVDVVQELLWHRIAQHTAHRASGSREADLWEPRATLNKLRTNVLDVEIGVTARISLPKDSCGAVIGSNGSKIRQLSEEFNVRINLVGKDDTVSLCTQERLLTISGEVSDCAHCTSSIISLMAGEKEGISYVNKSASYSFTGGKETVSEDVSYPPGVHVTSTLVTVSLSVPDTMVGQLIGKRGSTVSEIQARSGARVTISSREESDSDAKSPSDLGLRTVVISGPKEDTEKALKLVSQKLWQSVAGNTQEPITARAPRRTRRDNK